MAAVTFNPGYYLVAWTGPATTLGTATWFPNLNYVAKPSANRLAFVSNKFGANQSFAPFTQVVPSAQGQIISAYIFNVKTTFQLDDSLVGLVAPTAPVANAIPLASAATPATITLPANQVALTGSGTDSDGTIAGYVWRQVTGPNTATGLPATVQSLIVSNLIAGTYQFGFKVQDDKGALSVEQFVNVVVKPASTGLKNRVVMLYGNSNVYGDGGSLQDPLMSKFAAIVAATGESDTTKPYNYAASGSTTADAFNQIKQFMPSAYDATVKNFVVFIGEFYNSIRKDPNRTPAMEIALLQQISAYVKSFGSNVRFVVWTPGTDYAFTPDLALLDRPTINDELHAMAEALRAERDRPGSFIDALADLNAETVVDMSATLWTGDGIHGNDKTKAVWAQRIAWAIRQAIYGTPQPAPILRSDENYATGAKILTLGNPAGNPFTSSAGALNLGASAVAGYNNIGVDKYYLKPGDSGCWFSKIQTGDGDVVMSFSPNTNALGNDTYPVRAWINGIKIYVKEEGANKPISEATNGYFFGEYHDGVTGITTVFLSPDKVVHSSGTRLANAVTLYTYPTADKTAQYIKGDGFGPSGQISYLQGLGLTLTAGESAGGDGPVNAKLTYDFNDNQYVVASDGTLSGSGRGYCRTHKIADKTSGGCSMEVDSIAADYYSGYMGLTTQDTYLQEATQGDFMVGIAFRGGYLAVKDAGAITSTGTKLALGEKYRPYRNRDSGSIRAQVLRPGATEWENVYTFGLSTTASLYFLAHLRDAGGRIKAPLMHGATVQ